MSGIVYNIAMNWLKIFDKPKDLILKNALQYYLGRYIKRMLELSVDRENQNLHALVELVGEERPISIDIQYEIFINETQDEARIKANSISVSREWIDLIAQEFIGQEFHIEGKNSARIIKLVKDIGLV
jgi:hypothetical protein